MIDPAWLGLPATRTASLSVFQVTQMNAAGDVAPPPAPAAEAPGSWMDVSATVFRALAPPASLCFGARVCMHCAVHASCPKVVPPSCQQRLCSIRFLTSRRATCQVMSSFASLSTKELRAKFREIDVVRAAPPFPLCCVGCTVGSQSTREHLPCDPKRLTPGRQAGPKVRMCCCCLLFQDGSNELDKGELREFIERNGLWWCACVRGLCPSWASATGLHRPNYTHSRASYRRQASAWTTRSCRR